MTDTPKTSSGFEPEIVCREGPRRAMDALEDGARLLAMISEAWQPIATAPHDGTSVLVYAPANKCAYYDRHQRPCWSVDHWHYTTHGAGWYKQAPDTPWTHWMPLPEAPR